MIDALQEAMNRRLLSLPARIRPFTTETERLPRAVSLTGPRGVGKTVFLLHHARGRKLLYVSADSPLIAGQSLYAVIRAVFQSGYEGIIVDEVHFARDWSISLKAAYDEYPDRILWISDSSSLILRNGIADLSRRFLDMHMPLMSFREYLFLETGALHPTADPFLQSDSLPVNPDAAVLEAWRTYKQCGTRPFYPEQHFAERLASILDKTLYFDIPFFVPSITDNNLRLMKAVASTLAQDPIPRLSVNSLCADWAIGSDKLYQLLEVMENVGLLRIVRFERDRKAKRRGQNSFWQTRPFIPPWEETPEPHGKQWQPCAALPRTGPLRRPATKRRETSSYRETRRTARKPLRWKWAARKRTAKGRTSQSGTISTSLRAPHSRCGSWP